MATTSAPVRRRVRRLAVLLLCVPATGAAQSARIDGGVVVTPDYDLHFQTHLTPAVPPLPHAFGTSSYRDESGVIHRVLLDRGEKTIFGYDIRIERERTTDTYRLQIGPLTLSADRRDRLLGADIRGWKQIVEPGLLMQAGTSIPAERNAASNLRHDQVLELRLLTTASGQTLTEYLTIRRRQPVEGFQPLDGFQPARAREFHFAPGPAADFTVADAQLELAAPRVSVNDRTEPSSERAAGSARGALVWLYVPGQGRYVLSLRPLAEFGFDRAGEVRGSVLHFTIGSETFYVQAGDQIAPGEGAYHLYVRRDAGWRPDYPHANTDAFIVGAADRPEYLDAVNR